MVPNLLPTDPTMANLAKTPTFKVPDISADGAGTAASVSEDESWGVDFVDIEDEDDDLSEKLEQTQNNATPCKAQTTEPMKKRSVSFHEVEIREYGVILGDHPAPIYGPPVTIEWEPQAHQKIDLDEYEKFFEGKKRRDMMQLRMPQAVRQSLLRDNHTRSEILLAQEKARRYREKARANGDPNVSSLEVALDSALRKFKKWRKRRSGTGPDLAELWIQNFKQEEAKRKSGGMKVSTSAQDLSSRSRPPQRNTERASGTVLGPILEVLEAESQPVRRVQSDPTLFGIY